MRRRLKTYTHAVQLANVREEDVDSVLGLSPEHGQRQEDGMLQKRED